MESSEPVGFDSDGSSFIVEKYSNAHILSEEDMFTDKIEPIISNGMVNIGGKDIITKEIITVRCSCTEDVGQLHTHKLNNVIYFTE